MVSRARSVHSGTFVLDLHNYHFFVATLDVHIRDYPKYTETPRGLQLLAAFLCHPVWALLRTDATQLPPTDGNIVLNQRLQQLYNVEIRYNLSFIAPSTSQGRTPRSAQSQESRLSTASNPAAPQTVDPSDEATSGDVVSVRSTPTLSPSLLPIVASGSSMVTSGELSLPTTSRSAMVATDSADSGEATPRDAITPHLTQTPPTTLAAAMGHGFQPMTPLYSRPSVPIDMLTPKRRQALFTRTPLPATPEDNEEDLVCQPTAWSLEANPPARAQEVLADPLLYYSEPPASFETDTWVGGRSSLGQNSTLVSGTPSIATKVEFPQATTRRRLERLLGVTSRP